MPVSTYTKSGNKATSPAKLDKKVFGILPANHELLKAAYLAYLANGRGNYGKSKTRGEVIGSNIKPHRQKGTGRARTGSRYNPLWRGGGIIFGPTGYENYSHKLHTGAKRQAIRQALSVASDEGKIIVIESLEAKDGKTAAVSKLLDKIGAKRNTLIAVADKGAEITRAFNNVSQVKLIQARYLNVFDILNADTIVITSDGLKFVHEWLGDTK